LEASKEERLKGYKIKVQYQPVQDMEKKTKREAIGRVILGPDPLLDLLGVVVLDLAVGIGDRSYARPEK